MAFYSVSPVLFESVSNVTLTNSVEVGYMRSEGDENYIYVYNNGNSQISPGAGVTVSALSGYSVTVSSVSGDMMIGYCKHATIGTAAYGWVVTRGVVDSCINKMASTAIVAGDILQAGVDGGVSKGNSLAFNVGKAMTATGSAGTCSVFVCLY